MNYQFQIKLDRWYMAQMIKHLIDFPIFLLFTCVMENINYLYNHSYIFFNVIYLQNVNRKNIYLL